MDTDCTGVDGIGSRRSAFWWAASLAVAAWLLWMTLRPNQIVASDLSPLTDSGVARAVGAWVLVDLAGNVAVFIPLGMSLAFALGRLPVRRRVLTTVLAGAAFSLFIEVAQAGMNDRVAQLGDWLLNSVGMAVGAVAATWLSIRSRTQTREG